MATINFYLDKPDKRGLAPIHLRINCKGSQIKLTTTEKIKPEYFDKSTQRASNSYFSKLNHYLNFLEDRADKLLNHSGNNLFTHKQIKETLNQYIKGYRESQQANILKEQITLYGKPFTFVDLFAGAGGFSEGFLQAEFNNKYFEFITASDINENCELTHVVRYNHQLGLNTTFLRQDITEPDFLENLIASIGDKKIDVVCGGPPCQSFSLAGKRKKFDKKDDLFSHYLEVIKALQPKYFIMENVKGILTKEQGKIKELILDEINSIIDIAEVPKLISFIKKLKNQSNSFLLDVLIKRIHIEEKKEIEKDEAREEFVKFIDNKFKQITPKLVDYKTSKTDFRISTIRHGLNILARRKEWEKLRRDIIKEKDYCNVDNDAYVNIFTDFIKNISPEQTINKIQSAFAQLDIPADSDDEAESIITALKIYNASFEEAIKMVRSFCDPEQASELNKILQDIRLYKIEKPLLINASDFGVPQNRERVLFIGCRKDQKFISNIPPTVESHEKVTTFEALHDLDFIGNNQEAHHYQSIDISQQFNGRATSLESLLQKRLIGGAIHAKKGKTFAEWSRKGRLTERYKSIQKPFYVKNKTALENGEKDFDILNNHKTSNQNERVIKRLEIILRKGNYKDAQSELEKYKLSSNKRNYNVLKPEKQSATIMTIPDDYIHYNSPRALTVREMARLQSFDDSFVFQGKRSTGGNNRKSEIPQYTLVGNAVPPLLARAVAMEILKNIK